MLSWQDLDLNQPLNWAHPLNRGRMAWWLAVPGRYGAPAWWDLTAGRAGTLTNFSGGYGWNTASNRGGAGSLRFGSGSNYVGISLPSWPNTFSLLMWVNYSAVSASGGSLIAANSTNTWYITPSGHLSFYRGGDHASAATLATNTWLRLGLSFNNGTIYQYINGAPDSNNFSGVTNWAGSPAYLGNDNSSEYVAGYANDIALYNRVLSPAEFAADYRLSQQMYPDVLNWQFQDVLPIFPTSVATGVLLRNFVYRPRFEPAYFE